MTREETITFMKILCTSVFDIEGLSVRSQNGLWHANIKTWLDVIKQSPKTILARRNIGKKSLNEIEERMRDTFGDALVDSWSGDRKLIPAFLKDIEETKFQAVESAKVLKLTCSLFMKRVKDWRGQFFIECHGCPFAGENCKIGKSYPKEWTV